MKKANHEHITVKQPQPADAESIVNLLKQSWLDTYVPLGVSDSAINELFSNSTERVSKLTKYLKNMDVNNDIGLVARVAGEVVGICFGYKKEDITILTQIYVANLHQDKGIGRALLNHFFAQAHTDVQVSVYEKNQTAIDFYIANGFSTTSKASEFQLNPEIILSEKVLLYKVGRQKK